MREFLPVDFPALLRHSSSDPRIATEFRSGGLIRLAKGWYVDAGRWREAPPWERFVWAAGALQLAQPRAVFCGSTAVAVHGLPLATTPSTLDMAVERPVHLGRRSRTAWTRQPDDRIPLPPGRFAHLHTGPVDPQVAGLTATHLGVVQVNGFRTIPLLDAVVEVAVSGTAAEALCVLDAALSAVRPSGLTRRDLFSALERWPSEARQRRGERMIGLADPGAESPGESLSRAFFLSEGFEMPVLQQEFRDANGFIARADCWWQSCGVVGEFDGKDKWVGELAHRGPGQFEAIRASHERQARLQVHPQVRRVVRWTWADLRDPARLRERLIRAGIPRDPRWALREA